MKTLELEIDALTVESFPTDADDEGGADFFATRPQACDPFSVPPRCA